MRAVDVLRFLLELALLAALAVAGAAFGWWAAVLLPVLLVVAWGRFVAPKSTHRLPDPGRLALEIALFLTGGAALVAAGHPVWGVLLAGASIAVALAVRRPAVSR